MKADTSLWPSKAVCAWGGVDSIIAANSNKINAPSFRRATQHFSKDREFQD